MRRMLEGQSSHRVNFGNKQIFRPITDKLFCSIRHVMNGSKMNARDGVGNGRLLKIRYFHTNT